MRNLKIKDLLDLATAELENPHEQILSIYQWHFEKSMVSIKFILAAGGSILLALLLGLFKDDFSAPNWQIVIAIIASGIIIFYGLFRYWSLRSLHREYISSLYLLTALIPMVPFLKYYRSS